MRIRTCLFMLLLISCRQDLWAQRESQTKIDSLNNIISTAKHDTVKATALCSLCWYLNMAGDRQKAREAGVLSLQLADKLNYKYAKACALNNLATFDWQEGNLREAMDKLKAAATINEDIGNALELGHNLNNIGNIHYVKSEYAEAIKYYKLALKAYEVAGSNRWIANTYNNLSSAIDVQGNHPEALHYLFTGLKMLKEAGDKEITPIFYLNIGDIYMNMRNYPEALKNYQAYLALSRQIGNKEHIIGAYGAIGRLYEKQGKYKEALANFSIALKGEIELGNKELIGQVYSSFGSVYLHQSNYEEALKSCAKAAKIFREVGANKNLADTYINMGGILSKQAAGELSRVSKIKKYQEAIQFADSGLSLAKNTGAIESIKDGYRVLADLYKGMNDYQKALGYTDLYVAIKDSILNSENARKMEQLRTQYEVDKAVGEEQLKNAALAAEQKAARKRKNELLLTGITALAIISFFIALLIRQRNRKRRSVEKAETGHKMAELELQSLRAQLNPHFMFNSLNAIQDLILKEDNDKSHLYLSRFSKLLRLLLDNANQPFVTIKQELELLELYLSLENLRIPDLHYSIEKDPGFKAEERMIPNMMLQPYIENAIWHGLSNKKGERKLQVRIHENGTATEFEVEDNGIGREKAAELKQQFRQGHHSRGMQLLSKRFELLSHEYGSSIRTSITDLAHNGVTAGTLVKIDVPFSLSEQARKSVYDKNHHR